MRKAFIFAAVLCCAVPLDAGPGGCTDSPSLFPFAFEEISVSSTAIGFTAATAFPTGQGGADMAILTIEDDSVRYRDDGLNPTATVGQIATVTATAPATLTVCGQASIRRVRFIRVTNDADINVTYYRQGDN